ncbi:MAG: hypothetical protein J7L14_01570 [Candidatus Diapherotrites archaeon]|nr:hypothetical protein [Candidatus Diapherotrites archaeon]
MASKVSRPVLKAIAIFTLIFFITQLLGLAVAAGLIKAGIKTTIVSENPEDISNAFGMMALILIMTFVILILMKYIKLRKLIWPIVIMLVFSTSSLAAEAFIGHYGTVFGIIFTIVFWHFRKRLIARNIVAIMAVAVAGSLLGVSLGLVPVAILVLLVGLYDIIAVFVTKHMQILAKEVVKENLPFTIAMPTKEHKYELGGGDLVIPLMFASSALRVNFALTILLLLSSYIGILITLVIAAKLKRAMPAVPLQAVFMLLVFSSFAIGGML